DLAKNGKTLMQVPGGAGAFVVGLLVAFGVALAVIAAFLKYLPRIGLIPFGAYRVLLGAVVVVAALRGLTSADPAAPTSHLAQEPPSAVPYVAGVGRGVPLPVPLPVPGPAPAPSPPAPVGGR